MSIEALSLYSVPNSFYAARCRSVAYIKRVPLRLLSPPGGLGSAEFKMISPLGKVPALVAPPGLLIESQPICDYLEALFPEPPLYPDDPWERSQIEVLCRYIDLYLAPLFTPVWRRLRKGSDLSLLDDERASISERFLGYEALLAQTSAAHTSEIRMSDCALTPVAFLYRELYSLLREADPLSACPALTARFRDVSVAPGVKKVLDEMAAENARRRRSLA